MKLIAIVAVAYTTFMSGVFMYTYYHFRPQMLMWVSELPACPHMPVCVE